jgi:hypothetical protein
MKEEDKIPTTELFLIIHLEIIQNNVILQTN